MSIRFVALDSALVHTLQAGGRDANGQEPEHLVAKGGEPCRHCLRPIAAGETMLVVAHRPFPAPQPYAELGPIFLHATSCAQGGGAELPQFLQSPRYIVRGYNSADRIVYGTGAIIDTPAIPAHAAAMLENDTIAYCHVRSATNNCYHCRIERVDA